MPLNWSSFCPFEKTTVAILDLFFHYTIYLLLIVNLGVCAQKGLFVSLWYRVASTVWSFLACLLTINVIPILESRAIL